MNKTDLKNLLQKYNLRPNKLMGQNFLIDENILKKIIETADLNKDDLVLEVGPGLGILTKELSKKAKKVIAIEKDKEMVEALKKELEDYKNIEIICGDILEFHLESLKNYKVVANIPYYLTSHLIRVLLESENQPKEITILIQKEVAQRILPCSAGLHKQAKMTLLAISVQFYSKPEIISYIPKESFWPEPKIDSAIIKITDIKKPENINIKKFFKLVKAGFSSPRKQLANNLFDKLNIDKEEIKTALTECNLDIQVRAERLTIDDWIKLLSLTSPDGRDHTKGRDHIRKQKHHLA